MRGGESVPEEFVYKDSYSNNKNFVIVTAISGRGTLGLIQVFEKVKISSTLYIKKCLKPLLEVEVPKLYPAEEHKTHLAPCQVTSRIVESLVTRVELYPSKQLFRPKRVRLMERRKDAW